MTKNRLLTITILFLLVPGWVGARTAEPGPSSGLPPAFESNRGQWPAEVRLLTRDVGFALGLAADRLEIRAPGPAGTQTLQIRFAGANRYPVLDGERLLPGKVHYLVGPDAADWITDVPTHAAARYRAIYDGIDLVVGGRRGALTLEFKLAGSADHEDLVIDFEGVDPVALGDGGDVVVGHTVRLLAPLIVQQTPEGPATFDGRFLLLGGNRVAIDPAGRRFDSPMTIRIGLVGQPSLPGPLAAEEAPSLALAADGDVIVTGRTLPLGNGEAYVTRLNRDRRSVSFTTYFGGAGDDVPSAVAVDATGQVVVVGSTTSAADFPTKNVRADLDGGQRDAFVLRLSANGSDLLHSTLLGGARQDRARDVIVAPDHTIWVAGDSEGGFPVSGDAFDVEAAGPSEAWVARLSDDGSELRFSSWLGGSGRDSAAALAFDREWNVYVSGTTDSADFPLLVPLGPEPTSEGEDLFLLKFSPQGEVRYAVRVGGLGEEHGDDLAVDDVGAVYLSGRRSAADLTKVERTAGTGNAFVAKVDPDGTAVAWSAPLRGDGTTRGRAIALDDAGRIWVAGATEAFDAPTLESTRPARSDEFGTVLSVLARDGARLQRSISLDSAGPDSAGAIEARGREVLVLGCSASGPRPGAQVIGTDFDGHAVVLTRVGASLSSTLAAGCPGTINFDNSAGTGQWQEATNWDTDALPTASDDVCIDGFAVTIPIGTQPAGTLFVADTGSLSIQTQAKLDLASDGVIDGGLRLDNGAVIGTGALTLNGTFDWIRGQLALAGGVLATGPVDITGIFTVSLQDCTFRNTAVVHMSQGGIVVSGSSTIINDGTWEIVSDDPISRPAYQAGTFINNGIFRKTTATGTTLVTAVFSNDGVVDLQTGTLRLEGGGDSSGSFVGPGELILDEYYGASSHDLLAGSTLAVARFTVEGGTTVNVEGTYDVPGTLTMNGGFVYFKPGSVVTSIGDLVSSGFPEFTTGSPITFPTVTMTAGTISGSDPVTISGTFDWSGGALSSTGGVVADGTVNIIGTARHTVTGGTFRNTSTVNLSGTGTFEGIRGSAVVNDGTWELTSDARLFTSSAGDVMFTNNGTFRKTTTTGTSQVSFDMINNGVVEVLAGTLDIYGGFTQNVGSTTLNGGSLVSSRAPIFSEKTFQILGGILEGFGTVGAWLNNSASISPGLSAGLLTVDGNYTGLGTSALAIELGGLTPGTEYDRLSIVGAATLDGTLAVTLIDGFIPADGDSFTILEAGSISGAFAAVNTPVLPGGEPWQVTYDATSVVLTVGVAYCTDADNDGFAVCDGSCTVGPSDACGDCDDGDAGTHPGATELCDGLDNDCNTVVPADEIDGDGDGWRTCDGDCDDGSAASYPGAAEVCDGLDNDCDASVPANEVDADGDGVRVCAADCDDTDGTIHPGAPEIPCDTIDQNCNGPADDTSDGDGDGYNACVDCDDGDATTHPGAAEICDGLDNDCDEIVPANEADGDGDGVRVCAADCDDADNGIYPGAAETTCDGVDQNCNGLADDAPDEDDDGYDVCSDCDDEDDTVNPGATEVCDDGADNDCDGLTDGADSSECSAAGSRTICATLGDDPSGTAVDQDVFVFTGTAGEQITLGLDPVGATSSPGRATLILVQTGSGGGTVVGSDRTALPNQLTVTLTADGDYRVGVQEEPDHSLLPGSRFSGDYCLILNSNLAAATSLQPTASVEGLDTANTGAAPFSRRQVAAGSVSNRSRESRSGRSRSR